METKIYIEGGGNSKEERARLREGFRKLFEKTLPGHAMPRTVACGGRVETFRDFQIGLKSQNQVSLLLVDSEDRVSGLSEMADDDFAWKHLRQRDGWKRPKKVGNQQVMLMSTCMETWIAADRKSLSEFYGTSNFSEKDLPALQNLENRNRHEVQEALEKATRSSKKFYKKGIRSFELLAILDPEILEKHLGQFRRMATVLKEFLPKK